MPTAIQTFPVTSFAGGLNLRANGVQLLPSESPAMLNVDIDPIGGIQMRRVFTTFQSAALPLVPITLLQYQNATGSVKQIMVNVAGSSTTTRMYSSTGGNFAAMTTTASHTTAGKHRSATFIKTSAAGSNILNFAYITNGTDLVMTYDGTTCADLTDASAAFHDDFSAPTFGTCIKGAVTCVWQGSLWMANTLESAVQKGSRVRWSHPNNPQDWRSNDFIDIDVHHDGDTITALMPLGDRLYIFKNNSVHVITGFSPGNFQQSTISQDVGTVSQEAVCVSEDTLYWWDGPTGAYSYSPQRGLEWIFERLYPAITTGSIESAFQANVVAGWVNKRVWFSVTSGTASQNNATYIYDPTLWYHTSVGKSAGRWKQGGWTYYDQGFRGFMVWEPPGSAPTFLGITADLWVLKLDQVGDQDSFGYDYWNVTGANTTNAPDSAATSVTGDLDISAQVALTDWTPGAVNALIGKWTSAVDQRAYELSVLTTGELRFRWSTDGTAPNIKQAASGVAVPVADGTKTWVRAVFQVSTGNVTFYYSTVDTYGTWTLLASVAGAGATTMVNTTAVNTIGQIDAGTTPMVGKFYEGRVYSGIVQSTQTLVANPMIRDSARTSATTTTDTLGNVYTFGGAGQALVTYYLRNITSAYQTEWYDLDNPIMQKRWRRPEFIHSCTTAITFTVDTLADYDSSISVKTFNIVMDRGIASGSSLWGANWATMVWGAASAAAAIMINKGPNLGRHKAISFKINGQTSPTSLRWAVNGITLKYIPMRIRT